MRENNVFEFLFWNSHRTKLCFLSLILIKLYLFSSSRISNSDLGHEMTGSTKLLSIVTNYCLMPSNSYAPTFSSASFTTVYHHKNIFSLFYFWPCVAGSIRCSDKQTQFLKRGKRIHCRSIWNIWINRCYFPIVEQRCDVCVAFCR